MNTPTGQRGDSMLSEWHNYGNGSIYWRVTAEGVEIKSKGLMKDPKFTQQAAAIWKTYQQPILAASQKHGVPVPIIIATISTESSGNPKNDYRYEPGFYDRYIKNNDRWKDHPFYKFPERISASYGLMQIMYPTAYDLGFRGNPEDLKDPATNLDFGVAYIASPSQVKEHGWDPPKIACAYNAGSVQSTDQNAWGMKCYGDHLDRWVPAYNGAIEVTGIKTILQPPKIVAPGKLPPQPIGTPVTSATKPGAQRSTLRFLFPGTKGTPWKPMNVDIFKHEGSSMGDPVSYTINSPTRDPNTGYIYELGGIALGVYDFVFSDVASGSVLYDRTDYEVRKQLEVIDLRQNLSSAPIDQQRNRTISTPQEPTSGAGIGTLVKNFLRKLFSKQ